MSVWIVVIPMCLLAIAFAFFWMAKRRYFFSSQARDLKDVRWELKELRIEEFEMLLCPRSDEFVNHLWRLTPRLRREACGNRLKLTRNGLRAILWNAVLFEQVGRFRVARQEADPSESTPEEKNLACSIFDRATMCHVMAALCLAKLRIIELCRIAWPFYRPNLANLPVVTGHSLVAWYQHLVKDVLDLADRDEREWMYGDILFLLTGMLELEVVDA